MIHIVGIAGITGKFARLLADSLLKHHDVKIKGYCRDPAKVPPLLATDPQVSLVKGDAFDREAVQRFVHGCDVVVCCYLGDDELMVDGQKLLIDASEKANVPRYIASDWALDYTKLQLGQLFPKDPMIHIKAYLDQKKDIKGVHILVGGFMDPFFSPPFAIWDATSTTFKYWGTGDEVWEGTSYQNAADYTAAVCMDPDAVGKQKLVGGRATFREIVAAFERCYGVTPKVERNGSLDDMYNQMHEIRDKDPKNMFGYLFMFFQYYMINGQTLIGPPYDNSKYPEVKPVTWEDYIMTVEKNQLATAYFGLS